MSHLLMGAFNNKKQYTMPQNAMKNEIYKCPECDGELILRQGNIRAHHFSHKQNSTCTYLEKPSESFQHLGAKHLIQYKLQNYSIQINRPCSRCNNNIIFNLPKCDGTYLAELEYRFHLDYIYPGHVNKKLIHNKNSDNIRIADCAIVDTNNDIIPYIIEIYHTHKTDKYDRGEQWFEVNATQLLKSDINSNEINCIRSDFCEICIDQKYKSLDNIKEAFSTWSEKDKEFYIRYRLGQRVFRDNMWSYEEHERFSFHVDNLEGNYENDNILKIYYDLFPKINTDKKLISNAWKGGIYFKLIPNSDNHEEYLYGHGWGKGDIVLDDLGGKGTVEIIKLLIDKMRGKQNIVDKPKIIKKSTITFKPIKEKKLTIKNSSGKIITIRDGHVNSDDVYIKCIYSDKDLVKSLGARWNNIKKSWYIPKSTVNYKYKFEKWLQ
jgi:ssDNA-binding Zn-finger/Zn-ribbon topoisomerase 1